MLCFPSEFILLGVLKPHPRSYQLHLSMKLECGAERIVNVHSMVAFRHFSRGGGCFGLRSLTIIE